jgi:hypothetical protein
MFERVWSPTTIAIAVIFAVFSGGIWWLTAALSLSPAALARAVGATAGSFVLVGAVKMAGVALTGGRDEAYVKDRREEKYDPESDTDGADPDGVAGYLVAYWELVVVAVVVLIAVVVAL